MAMTKAERARMEELETALALCWPAYSEPQPMTRDEIMASLVSVKPRDTSVYRHRQKVALGWFFNAYNGDLSQGWSDGMYHNRNNTTGDGGTQTMGCMYRTKRDAAMALRLAMSRKSAKELAAIDRIVREEAA